MNKYLPLLFSIFTLVPAKQVAGATYTSYATFAGAAVGQSLSEDTFADLSLGTVLPSGNVRNGIDYQFSTSAGTNGYIDGTVPEFSGHFLTTGHGESFQPRDSITFTFEAPISAFGLNFYSAGQTSFLLLTNETVPQAANMSTASYDHGTSYFLGLVADTPFTSITFTGGFKYQNGVNMPNSGWTIPRVVYGASSVPLPSAFWFLSTGLLLIISFNGRNDRIQSLQ
ncbi:MAG: hypothetical protein ACU836_00080 [Gammaproteobacteria bacterium]